MAVNIEKVKVPMIIVHAIAYINNTTRDKRLQSDEVYDSKRRILTNNNMKKNTK